MKLRVLGLAGHVVGIGDLRITHKILLRKYIVDGSFEPGIVVQLTVLFASPII